jgi:diadenylate cyclase
MVAAIDFLLVYLLVYRLLVWISESHAESLVRGLLVVFALYAASFTLKLTTLNWLLGKFATVLMLLILIVFQPELRRFLERIGSGRLMTPLVSQDEDQYVSVIKQLLRAVDILSKECVGGLIVIELGTNLNIFSQVFVFSPIFLVSFWPLCFGRSHRHMTGLLLFGKAVLRRRGVCCL